MYYFDAETGSSLVEFVKMPTLHIEDFQKDPVVLKNAARIMNTLHSNGIKFLGHFDPVAGIDEYVNILKQKSYTKRYEGWDDIYKTVLRVRDAYAKNPPALAPCHNDVLAENFMYDGKNMFRDDRRAATARAVARSDVQEYQSYKIDSFLEADPDSVCLPLSQHIGAPCEPVVGSGDTVSAGQLIARCPEGKLGTNLHASIGGRVTVDGKSITITR